MSTRKRALEDGDNEQQAKRQKLEHNEVTTVHPFELAELVEAIVAHLLSISPLSILNLMCSSKRLRDVVLAKSLWLRQGFKQLYDMASNDFLPAEYLRAVLGQLELDRLKQQELRWGQASLFLKVDKYVTNEETTGLLECKFDLVHEERRRYDTRRLNSAEYLADRCLTDEAHRVLLNIMARLVNKFITIQQLIEFIEISEEDILKKQKQDLHEILYVPAAEYEEVEATSFNEYLQAEALYYPEMEIGPAKFYPVMMIDGVYSTVLYREEDFPSTELNFRIWKRFMDEHRSILIFDGMFEVANVAAEAHNPYIKFNSQKNLIEECGFLNVDPNESGLEIPQDAEFLKFIEFPFKKEECFELAGDITSLLFGDYVEHFLVERMKPPHKYFKNVKFRRTQSDIDFETNLCKVHSDPANIFFESVLPYLVNDPKSFLTFFRTCKSFRKLRNEKDVWKRLGFVHFAEWHYDYEGVKILQTSHIRRILRAIRRDFVHEKVLQLNSDMQCVNHISNLSQETVLQMENKLFDPTKDEAFVAIHGVRFQEYLANRKLTEEAAQMLMWLKRKIAVELVSVEDLIGFIELEKDQPLGITEMVTKVDVTVPQAEEQHEYLVSLLRGLWCEEDWDFDVLLQTQHTFTSNSHVEIDSDAVQISITVNKVFVGEDRSIVFIQSYCGLMSIVSEEDFYIKYDKSKNLIEECGTLSTFRAMNCPNEIDQHTVICMMLEKPGQPVGFTEDMLMRREIIWQAPLPEYHFKNIKFKKD